MNYKLKKQLGDSLLNNAPEELYQALFEQAGDAIFIADKQGRYIAVNQRGCDLLGYSCEEILHLSMQDLVPAEDQAHNPLRWADLRAGKIIYSANTVCAAKTAVYSP